MIFLRNLMRTKVRSLLTLLGVTVGTALFVSIASLTLDMHHQFTYMTAAYNTEVMIGSGNALTPYRSRISQQQVEALQATLGQTVSPMIIGNTATGGLNPLTLLGVSEQSFAMIPVVSGRGLNAEKPEILAGVLYAELAHLTVGDKLVLGNAEYTLVGLFRSGSRFIDTGLITGVMQARRILGRDANQDYFNMAMVQTGNKNASARVVELVRQHFPGLRAQPTAEFSGIIRIMRTMEISSWSIALIALLGAAIVVANTLDMVVSERTRELGVLLSIGWSPWLVLRMLFAEIMALCLTGTLLNNLAAQGLLSLLVYLYSAGPGWTLPTQIAPLAVFVSLGAAVVIGLSALLWPANVVYRLKPAEALRHG